MSNARAMVLVAFVVAGCHGDDAQQKAEIARLTKENEALRDEVKRLVKEAQERAVEDTDDEEDTDDDDAAPKPNVASVDPFEAPKDAYVHGHYQTAIELATPLVKQKPAEAYRLIGASYCFLGDLKGAKSAFNHLDPQGKQFLRYVCSRKGVQLGK